jgi:TetR/AcrR family tetracycline transcriptional repressor
VTGGEQVPAKGKVDAARGRAPVTREQIVDTALRLIDEAGLEALTIRTLAAELGVYPTTIQWHTGSKAQLLATVGARIFDELVLPNEHEYDWLEWIAAVCRQWRSALHRHPNVAPIVSAQLVVTPAVLPLVERVVGVLERAGFAGARILDPLDRFTHHPGESGACPSRRRHPRCRRLRAADEATIPTPGDPRHRARTGY